CVLHREKVFTGGHGPWVVRSKLRLQIVVERVTWFFVPAKLIRFERAGIHTRSVQVEAAIGVYGELIRGLQDFEDCFDATQIFGQWGSADLHLHDGITKIKIT